MIYNVHTSDALLINTKPKAADYDATAKYTAKT